MSQSHYQRGLETGKKCEEIVIAVNGVWNGRTKDGGALHSYEKIGYHAGTEEFLRGIFASECPVYCCYFADGDLVRRRVYTPDTVLRLYKKKRE